MNLESERIRKLDADEVLKEGEVELIAKKNCRKCYGRGIIGMDAITHQPHYCSCLKFRKGE